MRFSNIIVLYFVLGAVVFGGGAINYDNSGVAQYFVHKSPSGGSVNDKVKNQYSGLGSAITNLVNTFGGAIILVWNLAVGVVSFLAWPFTVCISNNVPFEVSLLLGGTPTVGFYGSIIVLIRSSG